MFSYFWKPRINLKLTHQLFEYIIQNNVEQVKAILENQDENHRIDINNTSIQRDGLTPLMEAARHGHYEICQF